MSEIALFERQLIDYLPLYVANYREIQAIMAAEQPEVLNLWQALQDVFDDQFIWDATENGVMRWEKILGIVPKATASLGERKFTILTKINEQLPFTMRALQQQLSNLCGDGYSVELQHAIYKLIVKVALTSKSNFTDVGELLKRVVPANLVIDLDLMYNQHQTLAPYTHAQLGAYTQWQLRNEVIN